MVKNKKATKKKKNTHTEKQLQEKKVKKRTVLILIYRIERARY